MTRAEFTRKTKREAYQLSGGICTSCRLPIQGRAEYDHVIPAALGGDNSVDNCQVLCYKCHKTKTGTGDVPRIRKADRQRDVGSGAKRSDNPMPGGRGSKWKKRISGKTELR